MKPNLKIIVAETDLPHRTLKILGSVPIKKNRQMGRNFSISREMKAEIESLTWQMKSGWHEEARSQPFIWFRLYVSSDRRDSDGMVTTLLDCMQTAGVLVNDNTKHLRNYNVTVYDAPDDGPFTIITVNGGAHMKVKRKMK